MNNAAKVRIKNEKFCRFRIIILTLHLVFLYVLEYLILYNLYHRG